MKGAGSLNFYRKYESRCSLKTDAIKPLNEIRKFLLERPNISRMRNK